jgi:hypothetical protein
MPFEPLVVVILVLAGIWWWLKRRSAIPSPTSTPEEILLRACRGNRESMDRLVAREADRAPGITRAEATRRALDEYRRDNR